MNRREFHRTLTAMLPAVALAQAQQSTTKERTRMQLVEKLIRFKMAVNDMPKAKAFYADKLGLKVVSDYRIDDSNW
ncbi:MAG TPA: VOC family protein, partial [Bryobacteraceae bacterium]|nr:VOC family protein [Bryobacteraceae bacterium]